MKVLCLLGRHKWRVDNSDPEQPFEVCDRCGHYRNDDSWTDRTAAADPSPKWDRMRPMDGGGGAGGGGAGGGGM
jgi:hypothetical protein